MRPTRAIRPVPCSAVGRRSAGPPPSRPERANHAADWLAAGLDPAALRREFPLVAALMTELACRSPAARTMRR